MLQARLPSGRGIRFHLLSGEKTDKILAFVGRQMTSDSTAVEFKRALGRAGAESMIDFVTEGTHTVPGLLEPTVKWVKFDAADYDKWFGPKDHEAVSHVYYSMHHTTEVELLAIVGGVTPVAET